jgi:hypothetical protein
MAQYCPQNLQLIEFTGAGGRDSFVCATLPNAMTPQQS